jgi:hypothetical protein
VVGEIGPELAVKLAHLAHDPDQVARIKAAAAPGDRMQMKSFSADCSAVTVDSGCHMHLEAGIAGCTRHRKAVRHEVPVFGHEVDHATRRRA